MRTTHTYVILKISPDAYKEIRDILEKASYQHTFIKEGTDDEVIDMHGIALKADKDLIFRLAKEARNV